MLLDKIKWIVSKKKKKTNVTQLEKKFFFFLHLPVVTPYNCIFRVHQGLIHIHGAGIAPNSDPDDATMNCFF